MANLVGKITVTPETLGAATMLESIAANNRRRYLKLDNEIADTLYYAFSDTEPADTTTMEVLQANTGLIFDVLAMPTQKLWLYCATAGTVKVAEGV